MTTTTKSTLAEIVAEAQAITAEERNNAMYLNQELIQNLKKLTGKSYGYSVKQAHFRLEIIDRSGKGVKVVPVSEFMPFYEFNQWLIDYNNAQHSS